MNNFSQLKNKLNTQSHSKIICSFIFLLFIGSTGFSHPIPNRAQFAFIPPQPTLVYSYKFKDLNACEKQKQIWQQILATEYKPYQWPELKPFGAKELLAMAQQNLLIKTSSSSDVAPEGWQKYLHAHGAVATVKFVADSKSVYTGLFQGADCGLIRLSLTYKVTEKRPVAPGLALKLFRNQAPSSNVSALVSLNGQGHDYNFFSRALSNIVPRSSQIGQRLVHHLFRTVSRYPEHLSARDFALKDLNGRVVEHPNAPIQLFFVPYEGLRFSSQAHDFRSDLIQIRDSTPLYAVYAVSSELRFDYKDYKEEDVSYLLSRSQKIGDIITTSRFVVSEFGDRQLLFRHQLVD